MILKLPQKNYFMLNSIPRMNLDIKEWKKELITNRYVYTNEEIKKYIGYLKYTKRMLRKGLKKKYQEPYLDIQLENINWR
jgi:hypothetical protein